MLLYYSPTILCILLKLHIFILSMLEKTGAHTVQYRVPKLCRSCCLCPYTPPYLSSHISERETDVNHSHSLSGFCYFVGKIQVVQLVKVYTQNALQLFSNEILWETGAGQVLFLSYKYHVEFQGLRDLREKSSSYFNKEENFWGENVLCSKWDKKRATPETSKQAKLLVYVGVIFLETRRYKTYSISAFYQNTVLSKKTE